MRTRHLDDVSVVESSYAPGFEQPVHRHERAGITLVLKGGVREQSRGCDCECLPGDILKKPAGVPHRDQFAPTTTLTLTLDFPESGSTPDGSQLLERLGYGVERRRDVRTAMFTLWRAMRANSDRFDIEGLVVELCAALDPHSCDGTSVRSVGSPPAWLGQVRDGIWDRCSERIRVGDLAAESGVHPVYLARVFRRYFDISVIEYITAVRLARSIELLIEQHKRCSAVAAASGFADQPHWCRVFKSRTGLTPRSYRTMLIESLR